MDEKIAEVANLTLRLREMSGKVAWWEALQDEQAADLKRMTQRADEAEKRAKEVMLQGVRLTVNNNPPHTLVHVSGGFLLPFLCMYRR